MTKKKKQQQVATATEKGIRYHKVKVKSIYSALLDVPGLLKKHIRVGRGVLLLRK